VVASVAQKMFADALYTPTLASVVQRLAIDPRMKRVWVQLRRREGGVARRKGYLYPASEKVLAAHDQIEWLVSLSEGLPAKERPQEQAAAVLFMEVVRFFVWDRRRPFGPKVQTRAQLDRQVKERRDLADQIDQAASRLRVFGLAHYGPHFHQAAADCREQASRLQPNALDEYVRERHSGRIGDEWLRGFIVTLAACCSSLFGTQMIGTVAILANVAHSRDGIDADRVRGVLRHGPGIKGSPRAS
jgi:hypothetical protein